MHPCDVSWCVALTEGRYCTAHTTEKANFTPTFENPVFAPRRPPVLRELVKLYEAAEAR